MSSLGPVLDLQPPGIDLPLLVVLLVAGLATASLLGLALAAFARRRSRSYFLVALAIVALLARTVVAGLSVVDALPATVHHLFEHALDVAMVALVVGAVYYARSIEGRLDPEERP